VSRPSRDLISYAAYLFDVDGTLVYHSHAVLGTAATLRALKDAGKHVLAVTNNSPLARYELAERVSSVRPAAGRRRGAM
jgi:ribonucleotide monophosphatase NagD (HAD superfamily)